MPYIMTLLEIKNLPVQILKGLFHYHEKSDFQSTLKIVNQDYEFLIKFPIC
jgi:hypothetical protein